MSNSLRNHRSRAVGRLARSPSLAAHVYAYLEEGHLPLHEPVPFADAVYACLCGNHGMPQDLVALELPRIERALSRRLRQEQRAAGASGDAIHIRFEDMWTGIRSGRTLGVVVSPGIMWSRLTASDAGDPAPATPKLLRALRELSPSEFEGAMCRVLEALGCVEITITGRSGDMGIDLMARWPLRCAPFVHSLLSRSGVEAISVVVQAKRYRVRRVGREEVQAFLTAIRQRMRQLARGRLELPPAIGMIVTSSCFSSGARQLAESEGVLALPGKLLAQWIAGGGSWDSRVTLR